MSFSIGPFHGKREAVIRAVEETTTGGDSSQLDRVKEIVLAELEDLPAGSSASVHAHGHHWEAGRNMVIAVNQGVIPPLAGMSRLVE